MLRPPEEGRPPLSLRLCGRQRTLHELPSLGKLGLLEAPTGSFALAAIWSHGSGSGASIPLWEATLSPGPSTWPQGACDRDLAAQSPRLGQDGLVTDQGAAPGPLGSCPTPWGQGSCRIACHQVGALPESEARRKPGLGMGVSRRPRGHGGASPRTGTSSSAAARRRRRGRGAPVQRGRWLPAVGGAWPTPGPRGPLHALWTVTFGCLVPTPPVKGFPVSASVFA